MQFKWKIDPNIGNDRQVGLFLTCISDLQIEEITEKFKKNFKLSKILPSKREGYTHFIYVTTTESELNEFMHEIDLLNDNNLEKTQQLYSIDREQENFKNWKNKFERALKKIDSQLSNQEKSRKVLPVLPILNQEIDAGRATELEQQLLQQASTDSNSLRKLIALYSRCSRYQEIINLCNNKFYKILALPVSGRLVKQIISAYFTVFEETKAPDLLQSAQKIAREFLPELERLRQATEVRQLLHQKLTPQEPQPVAIQTTLSEELGQLIEIEPSERIQRLKSIQEKYPAAANVQLALAGAYVAVGNNDRALGIYESVSSKNPAQIEEAKRRRAELLLDQGNFQAVLNLLSDLEKLSPTLEGLHGAALYYSGKKLQALPLLEKAWQEDERQVQILIPLARLWSNDKNKLESAAKVYDILLETAFDRLNKEEDYSKIEKISYDGGHFGDISSEHLWRFYELKQE